MGNIFSDGELAHARGAGVYADAKYGDGSLAIPYAAGALAGAILINPWAAAAGLAYGVALAAACPLIIDLGGDGFHFNNIAGSASNAFFDIKGNMYARSISWDTGNDGFLVRDLNANGKIDNVTEMFGDNGGTSAWAKLAALDSNSDNVINSSDTAFSTLTIWKDADHDGQTDSGELLTLAQAGITAIGLQSSSTSTTQDGQTLSGGASVTISGSAHSMTDVILTSDTVNTWYVGDGTAASMTVNGGNYFLPLSRGYGTLASWHNAMTQDAALHSQAWDIANVSSADMQQIFNKVAAFMYEWAGVTNVDPASRGAYVDARQLEFIEKMMDTPFVTGSGGTNPEGTPQTNPLKDAWDDAFWEVHDRLTVQGTLSELFPLAQYNFVSDTMTLNESLSTLLSRAAAQLPSGNAIQKGFYWDEVGSILGRHATEFGLTSAQVLSQAATTAGQAIVSFDHVFTGTASADTIYGTTGNDNIDGAGGNDYVTASSGTDYLFGNSGNDTLLGGDGDDTLEGGTGNDPLLEGGNGNDTYVWGSALGNDTVYDFGNSASGADKVILTNLNANQVSYSIDSFGSLTITSTGTGETLLLQYEYGPTATYNFIETLQFADNSTRDLSTGFAFTAAQGGTLYGSSGNDTLTGTTAGTELLYGKNGNDIIYGGSGASDPTDHLDTIYGGGGSDTIYGNGGNDRIYDGNGSSDSSDGAGLIYGGEGADLIYGNGGNDIINGGVGGTDPADADTIYGGAGSDSIYGNGGDDVIYADDTTEGNPGNDYVSAGTGNDFIYGGAGNDTMLGLTGNDTIYGGAGPGDTTDGADTLYGGDGNDSILGNAGDDAIYGEAGCDTLGGGSGADTFFYSLASDSGVGVGVRDVINSFVHAEGDHIDLSAVYAGTLSFIGTGAFTAAGQVHYVQSGSDTIVEVNLDSSLAADMQIQLTGLLTLVGGDFVL